MGYLSQIWLVFGDPLECIIGLRKKSLIIQKINRIDLEGLTERPECNSKLESIVFKASNVDWGFEIKSTKLSANRLILWHIWLMVIPCIAEEF